jgi:hypothetical protein
MSNQVPRSASHQGWPNEVIADQHYQRSKSHYQGGTPKAPAAEHEQ